MVQFIYLNIIINFARVRFCLCMRAEYFDDRMIFKTAKCVRLLCLCLCVCV